MSATKLIVKSDTLSTERKLFGLMPGSVNLPIPQAHERLVVSDRFGKVVPAEHLAALAANKPSELGHYYLVDVRKHSLQFPCKSIFRSRWGQLSILAFVDAQVVDPHGVVAGGIESLNEPVYRAVVRHLQGAEHAVHDELTAISSVHEVEHAVGTAFAKYGIVGELESAPDWVAAEMVTWRVRVTTPTGQAAAEAPQEVVLPDRQQPEQGARTRQLEEESELAHAALLTESVQVSGAVPAKAGQTQAHASAVAAGLTTAADTASEPQPVGETQTGQSSDGPPPAGDEARGRRPVEQTQNGIDAWAGAATPQNVAAQPAGSAQGEVDGQADDTAAAPDSVDTRAGTDHVGASAPAESDTPAGDEVPAGVDATTVDVRDSAPLATGVQDTPATSAVRVSNPAPTGKSTAGAGGVFHTMWG